MSVRIDGTTRRHAWEEDPACAEARAQLQVKAIMGTTGEWANEEGARLSGSESFSVAQKQGEARNPSAVAAPATGHVIVPVYRKAGK